MFRYILTQQKHVYIYIYIYIYIHLHLNIMRKMMLFCNESDRLYVYSYGLAVF